MSPAVTVTSVTTDFPPEKRALTVASLKVIADSGVFTMMLTGFSACCLIVSTALS